jgi:type I restriction enzyme S subunit
MWIFYLARSNVVMRQIETLMHGATYPAVTQSETLSVKIPVPPLETQRRIVARIEGLFAELGAARHLHAALVHDAERLMDAALADVFDEIALPSSKALEEITRITSGGTPLRSRAEYYTGEIPWVKTGELNDGIILESEEHITQQAVDDSSAKLFPIGTLLIAMYGQGKTRGRTGILGIPATTNQACCAIFPDPEIFLPHYLQFWFRSMYRDLRQKSEMRGGNQPNLNAGMIKALRPPLPPIPEQRRIVAHLDEVQAHAAELQHAAAAVAADLDRLEQSILAQAFEGKL